MKKARSVVAGALLAVLALAGVSCPSMPSAASAAEYYNLGLAYYDLGKFTEAEYWFLKAKRVDKTRVASEYNLGRIAFETGKPEEAADIFERLLKKDPDNVVTLKAAAFARLKNGDLEAAEAHYRRVVALLPETEDATYNYALVLHGLKKDEDALAILLPFTEEKPEDMDALLLLARVEKSLGRPEAVDRYAARLELEDDPVIRKEYAEVCEEAGLYARAVENYDLILSGGKADLAGGKAAVRFAKARALLVAGAEGAGDGGLDELETALAEGFRDKDALEALIADDRISVREEVARIVEEAGKKPDVKDKKKEETAGETDKESEEETDAAGLVQESEAGE